MEKENQFKPTSILVNLGSFRSVLRSWRLSLNDMDARVALLYCSSSNVPSFHLRSVLDPVIKGDRRLTRLNQNSQNDTLPKRPHLKPSLGWIACLQL